MSAWRGLHNPERHEVSTIDKAWCACSGDYRCSEESPCRCCLTIEVEAQTARADAAEAKVQRVRSRHAPVMECVDCGEYATELCASTHRTAEVCSLCLDMWEQAADYPCNEIRNLDGDS